MPDDSTDDRPPPPRGLVRHPDGRLRYHVPRADLEAFRRSQADGPHGHDDAPTPTPDTPTGGS